MRLLKLYGETAIADTTVISYTYSKDGRTVTYAYNGDGSVHSISEKGGDSDGAYVFEYDSLGRLMTWEKREELNRLSHSLMYVTQDFDESNRKQIMTSNIPTMLWETSLPTLRPAEIRPATPMMVQETC